MPRMLEATKQKLIRQEAWIKEKRSRIETALAKLNEDFDRLLNSGR